ncbi:MAG: HD domain-containing protein, partial [Armatimonadetes bacterium]|nr:HD domain-containing protein [Armatimonadota bacterium]
MSGRTELTPRVARLATIVEDLDPEPEHSAQVTRLAAALFDALRFEHGLGASERELLLAAGVLHDIGWSVSATRHHKISARLIEEMDLPDFDDRERAIIAALACYHRKALPKKKHRIFGNLSGPDRRVVRSLAAILRVADGLDRSHGGVVQDVSVE